jgi:hypothetical protein
VRFATRTGAASERAAIVALALLLTLPFLAKPFHIDDIFYLRVAENILKTPLDPLSGTGTLMDEDYQAFAKAGITPTFFEGLIHPPLLPYLLAAAAWLSGGFREWALHLAYLGFTLTACFFVFRLARRFSPFPLASTLFVLASPAFALPAQSLMTDMPSLALTLAAIALFIEGADSGRGRLLFAAGALLGLALLTRYTVIAAIAIWLAYLAILRRPPRHLLPALAGTTLVLLPWMVQNLVVHGQLHVLVGLVQVARVNAARPEGVNLAVNTLCDVAALGGVSWPVAVLLLFAGAGRRRLAALAAALAVATLVCTLAAGEGGPLLGYAGGSLAAMIAATALGFFLIAEALRAAFGAGRDGLFLAAWLAVACFAAFCVLPFGATRYMLPTLPALSWLLARGTASPATRMARVGARAALGLTIALSLALGAADQEFAATYQSFAASKAWRGDAKRVYFLGDWGFRYYMERAGCRFLFSTDVSPQAGDLVVRAYTARLHDMSDALRPRLTLLDAQEPRGRWPLRLLNHEARAGFYSHGWGFLPYAVSTEPLDRFEVYRVRD